MAFDVGIGTCRAVSADAVEVWADSSIVRRLVPETKWQRNGISVLQVPAALCSSRHALLSGEEVYLDTARIDAKSHGTLDVEGDGRFARVRLALLVPQVDPHPQPAPVISRKGNWRG